MKNNLWTIGQAGKEAGITPFVIRAWEKRYQITDPIRTANNRRLYTEADVERLCLLAKLTKQGMAIGQLVDRSVDDLRQLLEGMGTRRAAPVDFPGPPTADAGELVESALAIVHELDMGRLLRLLNKANVALSKPQLIHEFITPLLHEVGLRWEKGEMRVAHEHMCSAGIRMFLSNLLMSQRPPDGAPVLVACTPTGQDHEIGALIAGLISALDGWRVCYLGANMPAEEIAAGALQARARAVALSVSYPTNDIIDFEMLRELLPQLPIIIGGQAVSRLNGRLLESGFTVLGDLSEMQELLRSLR